jgi:hypothetical protein
LLSNRIVALCDEHAERLREAAVVSTDEARRLFPEIEGRRSLLDRRSVLDRRLFPPRPEGRRARGRRKSDAASG